MCLVYTARSWLALVCGTAALGAEVFTSQREERVVSHTCKSRACPSCGHQATPAGVLVAVRQSKTNPDGDTADLRYLKNGAARAVRTLRAHVTSAGAAGPAPTARVVPLTGQQIGQRFTAAASAAGLARRVTAHSGRVGLASELTARGASTTAVMLAGNWKTARMVAHYSAGATAERGAVATYL